MKRAGRADARQRWARIAEGRIDDPETRAWLQDVAAAILRADDEPDEDGKQRPGRIMAAAGLAGRKKNTAADAATLVALDRMRREPGGDVASRVMAAMVTQDNRWMGQHRTAGEAFFVAVADLLGMPHDLADTPDGRDKIQARIRIARREP